MNLKVIIFMITIHYKKIHWTLSSTLSKKLNNLNILFFLPWRRFVHHNWNYQCDKTIAANLESLANLKIFLFSDFCTHLYQELRVHNQGGSYWNLNVFQWNWYLLLNIFPNLQYWRQEIMDFWTLFRSCWVSLSV